MTTRLLFVCFPMLLFFQQVFSQTDTLRVRDSVLVEARVIDTTAPRASDSAVKRHSPRKAAIRSAILPGWGQAYNRKYWKIPIVWGALGTTAVVFRYNIRQYRDIQFAYRVLKNRDVANYPNVAPELRDFIVFEAENDLFNARSEVRQNIDYTALIFLGFWGLNVIDALVDAHLKEFDVTPDLSFKLKPGFTPGSNNVGLTLVMDLHKAKFRTLPLP